MQPTEKKVQSVEHPKRKRFTFECILKHPDTMWSVQPTTSSTEEIVNHDEPYRLVIFNCCQIGAAKHKVNTPTNPSAKESQMARLSWLFEKGKIMHYLLLNFFTQQDIRISNTYYFCFLLLGSTSYSPDEHHTIPLEITKGTNSYTKFVAWHYYYLFSVSLSALQLLKILGTKYQHKSTLYINRLWTLYIPLQQVPWCKFCDAMKLPYEPHGFYCRDRSVKLVSHKLPDKLWNLYFGNIE